LNEAQTFQIKIKNCQGVKLGSTSTGNESDRTKLNWK